MKPLYVILFVLAAGIHSSGQQFLNGDFEINTAGFDQINISNAAYNGFMSNSTAYGSYGDMDIISSATYCGLAQNGQWYIAFTAGNTDAITMELSESLVAGQTYSFTYWDRACSGFSSGPQEVQIGTTSNPTDNGTIVYTAPLATESVWTQRTVTFVAPANDLYISVSLESSGDLNADLGYWTQVDNFAFEEPTCPFVVDLGPDQDVCEGSIVTLDATLPGGVYEWSDNSVDSVLQVTTSGTYSVTVTVDDCVYTDEVEINVVPPPIADLGPDQLMCEDEIITLDATTPGATYEWQNGSEQAEFDVTAGGEYFVTITLANCSSSDTVFITAFPLPEIELGESINSCEGDTVILSAFHVGYTYEWQDGSTDSVFVVTEEDLYTVQVFDGNCYNYDEVTMTFTAYPVIELGEDVEICFHDSAIFDAQYPGAQYLWSDNSTGSELVTSQEGTYVVSVSVEGCAVTDTVSVMVIPQHGIPLSLIASTECVSDGKETWLRDENGHEDLVWSTLLIADSIVIPSGGMYMASYVLECEVISDTVLIDDCPFLDFYVPNAFTPDGDGVNDIFFPSINTNYEFEKFYFAIFNRWGDVIYTTDQNAGVWDGGYQGAGHYVPNGVYIWRLELVFAGQVVTENGFVTLIR